MKNINYLFSIIALIFFTACASTPNEDISNSASSTTTPGTTPDTIKSVWKDANNANAQAIPAQSLPATPIMTAALNPAHGQPNHRCDIEVGAPLNSPRPPMQQSLPAANTLPSTGAQGVKINPAHGQPGHDCAVAVGAPLK